MGKRSKFERVLLLQAVGAILATWILTYGPVAVAQSSCAAFLQMMSERNNAVSKARESVGKLKPGPAAFCATAKELAQTTIRLKELIAKDRSLCNESDMDQLAKVDFKLGIATSQANFQLAEDYVQRLCL